MRSLYWIVAAGTGGHIFPGINLAKAIAQKNSESEFLFFGTSDRLEARLVPAHGFKIKFLKASRWKGSGFLARVFGLIIILRGVFEAVLCYFQNRPNAIISVGGYVSVPLIIATRIFRVPLFIVEPNIRAGLANRVFSRFAKKAYTTPGSDALSRFKCPVLDVGSPVRNDIRPTEIRVKVKKIYVLGGSQGALSLCRATLEMARDLNFLDNGIELELQSGENNLEQSLEWQREFGVEDCTRVVPFIYKIPSALSAADVVVARAGASTIAELSVAGLPTVFVPYPYAADNHQWVNAKMLADDKAAVLVDERSGGFAEELSSAIQALCLSSDNFDLRKTLSTRFKKWSRPHADQTIAHDILTSIVDG